MEASKKKGFQVKLKSLTRTFKEYKNYKNEVESYDLNQVSQNKKTQQFYQESQKALEYVEKSLVEYCLQLNVFIDENKQDIQGDESVKDEYENAKNQINDVKVLFPAVC